MSAGTLRILFGLVIVFLLAHVGYKLVPMYFDYQRMKDEMSIKASVAQVLKDEEIRGELVQKAKELELPLGPQSFVISRNEEQRTMTISAAWEVEVHFLFDAYIRTFTFTPRAEESYTKGRR
jgi:hypothetical protein